MRNIGTSSALEAELWALRDGLMLAADLHLLEIHDESNAKEMIKLLLHEPSSRHHYSNLLCDCRYLMRQLRISTVEHIFREANKCVDILANQGSVAIDSFVIFNSTPSCLSK